MTADSKNVTETRPVRPSTLRVRRHRERRREHLRLLTVEIPEPVIEDAIARGLLKIVCAGSVDGYPLWRLAEA